jgi:hypothetical protein
MELLWQALAFLIYIIAGGGVVAAILIFCGIYPVQVSNITYVFTQQKSEEVIEELNIIIGEDDEQP